MEIIAIVFLYIVGAIIGNTIYNITIINKYLLGDYKDMTFKEAKESTHYINITFTLMSWLVIVILIILFPIVLFNKYKK